MNRAPEKSEDSNNGTQCTAATARNWRLSARDPLRMKGAHGLSMIEGAVIGESYHMEFWLWDDMEVAVRRQRSNLGTHELDVYALMQQDGMLLLNLTVKKRILDAVCFDDPHHVWRHLRTTFYRDSPYNFAVQEYKVHSLHEATDRS